MSRLIIITVILAISLMAMSATALAAVHINSIFTNYCVLQRGVSVPVWGTAADGENVTVTFNGQTVSTTASGGKWRVNLAPMAAGGPYTMTIAGSNTVTLDNVLVGEVWVASGQSNMEFRLYGAENGDAAAAASADPLFHFVTISRATSATPPDEVGGSPQWSVSSQYSTPWLSAVAYFFGRELRRVYGVPVGIIAAAYLATPAQYWVDASYIAGTNLSNPWGAWGLCYHGMIEPLQPYAIKGVIWYHGEQNAWGSEANQYQQLMTTLIKCWRTDWGQGCFPFLTVQIAPYTYNNGDDSVARLREAQLKMSESVPRTAMVVITDVGDCADIHPLKKEPVGVRLALAAENMVYQRSLPFKAARRVYYTGPVYRSMTVVGNQAIIQFDGVGRGLVAKNGPLIGWTIAGSDRVFYSAQAQIRGNEVVVTSPQVANPVAVRYGWEECPSVNLFNQDGLSASPFRTDGFN